jgi:ribulose-5-phosphate 4-epimerase/fuculose-1-phosphate aldolase
VGDGLKPSVDTPNHAAIYRARPDVGGVVHTHSPHATAFSVVHAPIPALVAEAAGYLGGPVRVLDDVQPARPDQADRVAGGLGDDRAVLLPNHGVIAVGETLRGAFDAAALVEHSARVAWLARSLGPAHEVPEDEIRRLHDFLHREYGQR